MLSIVGPKKVRVSKEGVAAFNARWPASELSDSRAYWFEFDSDANLIDSDVPEHSDGAAALAMSQDCERWLFNEDWPEWAPEDAPTEAEETAQRRALREMIRLASCLRAAKNERERKQWRDSLFAFTETARDTL